MLGVGSSHTEKSQLPLGSLNPRCGSICLRRLSTGVPTLAAPAKLPSSTFITVPLLTKNTFPQLPTLQQMNLFGSLQHCKARPNTSLRNPEAEVPHPGAASLRRGDPILISSFLELQQESHVLTGSQLPCPG